MKKTLTTLFLLALTICASAQEKVPAKAYSKQGKTFVQTSARRTNTDDTPTAYVWRDKKGNEYPIILHTYTRGEKAGRTTAYVVRTSSKTGKEYKYYLPNGEEIAREILNETR